MRAFLRLVACVGKLVVALLMIPVASRASETIQLATGTYHAVTPPGWDGKRALPAVMFLHGWKSSGAAMAADADLTEAAGARGFLFVAPDGLFETWAHVGSPSKARDDRAFLHAVLDDAERRWPVDKRLVVAAGFSQGATMVWDLACHDSRGVTAFVSIAGDFWEPYPKTCEAGPAHLFHIHGRADGMIPMEGRTLLAGLYVQGALEIGLDIWRRTNQCAPTPSRKFSALGDLDCEAWDGCGSGKRIQTCYHPGGHVYTGGFLGLGLDWARGLAPAG